MKKIESERKRGRERGFLNSDVQSRHCSHLQFLAVLIVHRHGHLYVLGCGFAAFVEISLDQSHVDVIPHVTCGGAAKGKKKCITEVIIELIGVGCAVLAHIFLVNIVF